MDPQSNIDIAKIKKTLLYTTIALISFCAFIGIIAIFVGSNTTLWQVMSTAFILYLVMLFSSTNILRLSDPDKTIMICAIVVLLSNILWGIPWILLVWGVFGGLTSYAIVDIWRFVITFITVSVFCTILARNIPKIKRATSILKIYSSISTVFVGFICFDLLMFIWDIFEDFELLGKFILAEIILVLLQWIVTSILIRNQNHQNAQNHPNPIQPSVSPLPNTTPATNPTNATDNEALRAQIEKEVRAKIAAEQASQQDSQQVQPVPPTSPKDNSQGTN